MEAGVRVRNDQVDAHYFGYIKRENFKTMVFFAIKASAICVYSPIPTDVYLLHILPNITVNRTYIKKIMFTI